MANNITRGLLLFFFLFLTLAAKAQKQKQYSTFEYKLEYLKKDSLYRVQLQKLENDLYKQNFYRIVDDQLYSFKISFHNLTNWTDSEFSRQQRFQLDALNRDFNSIPSDTIIGQSAGISFIVDTEFSNQVKPSQWDDWESFKKVSNTNSIQVWVIDLPDNIGSYVSLPDTDETTEGIVIDQDYFGIGEYSDFDQGKTLTVLIAQYFGLKPLLGSHPCADDEVSDTPRYESIIGCDKNSISRCDGMKVMPNNFLSPTPDNCRNFFTVGQVYRMKKFIKNFNSLIAKTDRT